MGVTDRYQKSLMEPLGLSETTLSRKIKYGRWGVDDIDALAEFFGVPVSTFFEDAEEIRRRVLGGSPLPWITALDDERIAKMVAECEGQLELLSLAST